MIVWIKMMGGDLFEGTLAQFEDCFGGFGHRIPSVVIIEIAAIFESDVTIYMEEA